jgi:hypothetical protein
MGYGLLFKRGLIELALTDGIELNQVGGLNVGHIGQLKNLF